MCSFKNNYKEQRIAARTYYSLENRQKGHSSRNFEVCVPTPAALPNFIIQVLSNQLHFLANRNKRWTGYYAIILARQLHIE